MDRGNDDEDDDDLQCLEVITLDPDAVVFDDEEDGEEDDSPSLDRHAIELFSAVDDDDEDDEDVEYLIEQESSSGPSSLSSAAESPEPFPASRIFSDELELLLTNVDGDDTDPDLTVIPGPARAQTGGRRPYRKSMSLPMSPVGGARQRLDSFNFSEFLFSPLKMAQDGDTSALFEDDFNLLNYVDTDPGPVLMADDSPPEKKEKKLFVAPSPVEQTKPAVAVAPIAVEPKKTLSKGKCLDLLRSTHERQENLVKRCVAIDQNKRVAKNLFPAKSGAVAKKSFGRVATKKSSADASLKSDPNWSPDAGPTRRAAKSAAKSKEQKTNSGNSQGGSNNSARAAGLASGNSNLSELKRRFLANIPTPVAPKRRTAATPVVPAKVIRTDVPVLPLDHNYCSPVKRSQPLARTVRAAKSAILIEEAPPQQVKKEKSPAKLQLPVPVVVKAEPPARVKCEPLPVPVIAVKKEPVEVTAEPSAKRRTTINLEEYKRMRASSSAATVVAPLPKDYVDPISEAKEKALRMQERRKAARLKQEELRLNTTPLVPILPLAVMTGLVSEEVYRAQLSGEGRDGQTGRGSEDDAAQRHLPFDEIMIVSVGCNTRVSVRPDFQSTALLPQLAKSAITSNSLLSSIQDVVIKKAAPHSQAESFAPEQSPTQLSPGKPEGANEGVAAEATQSDHSAYHHGEDKIIMHLRKDRIRPSVASASCQTELTAEFPALKRLVAAVGNKRNYRRRSTSSCSSRSRSRSRSSSGSESDSGKSRSRSRSSSFSESSSSSCSESEDYYGRSTKRRRLYSNRSWSRSRSRSQSCRRSLSRERSRFRSRSPRSVWARDSRSRSRSRDSRPVSRVNNRNNNNSNSSARWKNIKQSPEERPKK